MDLGALPSLNKRLASKTEVYTSSIVQTCAPYTTFGKIDESAELSLDQRTGVVNCSLMQLKEMADEMEGR